MTNHIMTKLTYQNQDQRDRYLHLMMTLHLILKMTTQQSFFNLHPNDHAKQIITDTLGFKPFINLFIQLSNIIIVQDEKPDLHPSSNLLQNNLLWESIQQSYIHTL